MAPTIGQPFNYGNTCLALLHQASGVKVKVKVKLLGYSLHPVILLCRLHILHQVIGPVHSWFHLNSPGSIQPGCSLVHRTDQLTMPSLPSLYHFLLLLYGAYMDGCYPQDGLKIFFTQQASSKTAKIYPQVTIPLLIDKEGVILYILESSTISDAGGRRHKVTQTDHETSCACHFN